jgi:hypothetical protein
MWALLLDLFRRVIARNEAISALANNVQHYYYCPRNKFPFEYPM